jgi:hypothetical protein
MKLITSCLILAFVWSLELAFVYVMYYLLTHYLCHCP